MITDYRRMKNKLDTFWSLQIMQTFQETASCGKNEAKATPDPAIIYTSVSYRLFRDFCLSLVINQIIKS